MKRQSRILALALIILLIVSVFTSCSIVDKLKEGMGGVTAAISQVKNAIIGFFNPNYDPKPGTTTTTPAGCDHVWYAPTCTEPQTCSECGETKGEALGHVEVIDVAVSATCEEAGKTEGKHCSRCNAVLVAQEVVPATGHNDTVVVTLEPTCLTPGVKKLTCSVCGFDRTEGIDPLGHEYDSVVTDPTCSERGYTTHTCKREGCDYSLVDSYTDALGHDHSVKTVVKDSTCVEKGTLRYSCSRCDDYREEEIALKDHSFVETVTTKPSCEAEGVLTTTCTGCDYHKETPIAATGHKNSLEDGATCTDADVCTVCGEELERALTHKWVEDKGYAATCTEKGLTDGKHCERCGHIEVAQEEIPAIGHKWGEWATTLAPTCTANGSERRDCDACDHYETRLLVAPGHKWGEWATTLAPTCTANGSERRDCDVCDHYEENVLAALGHDYKMTTVDPTCEENGYDSYDCTRCDDSYIKNQKPAPGHTWVKGTTVAPNCTEQGYTNYSCFCGAEKKDDYVSATGHTYKDVVTAPTCTEMGYTTHTCDCGDVVVDTYTSAKGHSWGAGKVTTDPKCGVEGERTYTCSCGETRTEVVDALEHIYDAVVTAPTCEEDGYTTHTCRLCNYDYVDSETAATGHDYDTVVTAPTCEAGGYTTHTCRLCGDDYEDSETAATGHDYDTVVTAPTCTEEGYTTYTCHCGESYVSDKVDALGHDKIVDAAVAPTCTTTGLTEGSHCDRCKAVLVAQEEVSATGHNYNKVVTAPDCINGGYTTYTCHCGDNYVADLEPANGHDMTGEWVVTTKPTCDDTGIATLACKNCDNYSLEKTIGALGHDYSNVTTVDPTCTTEGYTRHDCTRCDDYYDTDVTPVKHNWDENKTKVEAPTCTKYGYTVYVCADCEYTEIGAYVEKLGHDWGDATCTEVATCKRDGCNETTGDVLGHDIVTDEAVAPTCTQTGLTAGQHCSRCDAETVEQEVVPAKGHRYSGSGFIKSATCTEDAEYYIYCGDCDTTFYYGEDEEVDEYLASLPSFITIQVKAFGHAWVDATCQAPKTCSTCGETEGTKAKHDMVLAEGGYYECGYECGRYEVKTYEGLVAAFENDNAHVVMLNDIEGTAVCNSGYGIAGIVLNAGDVLDGGNYKLTVNGANSTWDCAVAIKGGELKNITVSGAFRGVFMPGANGDVVIDNCVFDDVIYTFNSDAGSTEYSVTIKNSEIYGWTSFSNVHKSVTFENCVFGEGNGYQFCRPYQPTTFVNCTFNEGFEIDARQTDGLEFTDCNYNGVALSFESTALFYNGGTVTINGVETHFHNIVIDEAVAAGCESTGLTEGSHCTLCDDATVEQEVVGALGHDYGDWTIDRNATCTEDGSKHRECANGCGVDEVQNIPHTGHTAGNAVVENNVNATCTTGGSYDSVTYCTVCGVETSRATVTVDALGHTAGSVVVENEVDANCTTGGSYDNVTYCTVCGDETSREHKTVDALGHTAGETVVENEVDATCTTGGSYDNVTYCTVCGDETSRATVTVDALGHTPKEAVTENVKDATCTEHGSYDSVVYCDTCDTELSRGSTVIPAKGHSYNSVVTAPTCTEAGYTTHTCSCGDTYTDSEVAAMGHLMGDWTYATKPTFTAAGTETRTCQHGCGHSETQTAAKLTKVYLKPNSNWTTASARFAAYFFNNSTNTNTWVNMTDNDGDGIYECTIPAGTWPNVIFCRMNPSKTTNNWDNKWNQTGDLTISSSNNLYTINSGSWDAGKWSTFRPSDVITGTLFFTPTSEWKNGSAGGFAAYFFGNGDAWVMMTDADGDGTYECVAPDGYYHVIFVGLKASTPNWDNKEYQTENLTPANGNNHYTLSTKKWSHKHALASYEGKDATCEEDGWNAYEECTCDVCTYSTKVVIEKSEEYHDLETGEAQSSTCTTQGWNTYEYCTICGYTTKVLLELDSDNHTWEEDTCKECEATLVISWEKLTDSSTLEVGDKIIIVAANSDFALSTTQNNNNRGQISITKNEDGTLTINDSVQIITLENGIVEDTFAFNVGDGYLYAVGGTTNNHLKLTDSVDEKGSWKIDVNDGVATIVASVSGRNTIRHNTSNSIFSCYASGQNDVSIYVLVQKVVPFHVCAEHATGATCTKDAVCSICGEVLEGTKASHDWTDADCTTPKTCSVCKTTEGEALGHTTENGVCERCGETIGGSTETEPITVSKTMAELITANGWTSSTTNQSFDLDDKVTVKINGGSNTGKAYDGDHIRIYATDSPAGTITISVPEGYELVSIKISTQTGTYAYLYVDGTTTDISNTEVAVSGSSVLLNSVKNGTNGKQVRVTGIEVTYQATN